MSWLDLFCKLNVFGATTSWLKTENLTHEAFKKTSSTNEIAKAEAFSISSPFKIYLTDEQTAGRGRGSNTWSNPQPGHSLMSTFSFNVALAPQPITAPLAGLAIYKALRETWGDANFAVKAPNDILLNGNKVCGILVETVQMGAQHRLVIGLGLNALSTPAGLPDATHLASGVKVNKKTWSTFLKKLVMHLQWVAQGSQTAHLSDGERTDLLKALNFNPNLKNNYVSLSPFGDLVTETETISWRSL